MAVALRRWLIARRSPPCASSARTRSSRRTTSCLVGASSSHRIACESSITSSRGRRCGHDVVVVESFDPLRSRFAVDVDAQLTRPLLPDEERLLLRTIHHTVAAALEEPHLEMYVTTREPSAHGQTPAGVAIRRGGYHLHFDDGALLTPRAMFELSLELSSALNLTGVPAAHHALKADGSFYSNGLRLTFCSKPMARRHTCRSRCSRRPASSTSARCVLATFVARIGAGGPPVRACARLGGRLPCSRATFHT
jgi:hypothetical protein